MRLNTLNEALEAELADLYDAERQLIRRLPVALESATNERLKGEIQEHIEETREHAQRLERAFEHLNLLPRQDTCEAMRGLLTELDQILACEGVPQVKDAVLIGAMQRIEHYEIAGYRVAKAFAEQLEFEEIADLLGDSLDEEIECDKKLTILAEGRLFSKGVIRDASQAEGPRA